MSTPFTCRILLLAALFSFSAPAVFAAGTNEEWLAQSWQTEDGLLDNSVGGIAQTADGYLWVGAPTGLARFDGLRFEDISLTNLVALPNRGVGPMIVGRQNSLWLGMDRGAVVHLAGGHSKAFVEGLPDFTPSGLAEGMAGELLIAYRTGSVWEINGDKISTVGAQQGLPAGADICALSTDQRGRIWFGKEGQAGIFQAGHCKTLCQVDLQPIHLAPAKDGGMWICAGHHLFKYSEKGELQDLGRFHPDASGTMLTTMIEDHKGDIWVGTTFSGLFRRGPADFEAIPTSHQGIISLLEDREGNIWAGTFGGGLDRIRPRAIKLEGLETGLPFPSVQSICQDTNGTVWAVTQNGLLVRKTEDHWLTVSPTNGWPGNSANCVAADLQGRVWVGAGHGLYCWRDGQFVSWGDPRQLGKRTLHTLQVSRSGDLWMGVEPAAILRLHDGHIQAYPVPPTSRIIRAMAEDERGTIWAGTSRGLLLRVDDDNVTDATPRPAGTLASIRCLYATPDGSLWIGYAGWGLGRLKDGVYREINSSQGLFDDYISHMVADGQGWLWFGSNRGIFKVHEQDFDDLAADRISRVRPVHYGRGDLLPSLQGISSASPNALRSADGRLWIPMQTALVVVAPAKIYENPEPPPTLLTRVWVDDRVVAEYENQRPRQDGHVEELTGPMVSNPRLNLPPGHRSIKFEFTGFNFTAPDNIQFRHRLQGIEDDWVEDGATRFVTYPRLDSGNYDFEVTACNGNGDWNPVFAQIALQVAPFFWATWWFRLAVVLVFTLSLIVIVRYISFRRLRARLLLLEQQAALQRERTRIAKDIHDDLGAGLTQIAYLGELAHFHRDEPEKVAERIGKMSATARQAIKSLDEIVWAVNPRNDTLAHLIDYANQFAFGYLRLTGIRVRLDFPDQIPHRELSADLRHNIFLVVKEALHNIVKHAAATEVRLSARVTERDLEFAVEDNGRGFAGVPDDALADGLRNMRQRMSDIGGECRIESHAGRGTRVILHLFWPETGK